MNLQSAKQAILDLAAIDPSQLQEILAQFRDSLAIELIRKLEPYSDHGISMGECSEQVYIPLAHNRMIRIGVTDSDVAAVPGLWVDELSEESKECYARNMRLPTTRRRPGFNNVT